MKNRRRLRNAILALLALAGTAGTLGYWYYNTNAAPEIVRGRLPGIPSAPSTRLYRWQDPAGRWQLSDSPPEDGRPYETVEYRSDANVIPSGQ